MKNIVEKNKKHISYGLILLIYIVSLLVCFGLFYFAIHKAFSITNSDKYNYRDKSNLDYRVYLKENNFYDQEYLGKDMIYVASLIDKVNVDFNYNFNSDRNLDLNFKYKIIGKLTIQDEKSKNNYYEEKYTLLEEKTFDIKSQDNYEIGETISIDYDYYNSIANKFKMNYGVDALSKLTIYFSINKDSISDEVVLSDIDVMMMEIPLSERSVNIKMEYKEIDSVNTIISEKNILIDNIIYMIISIVLVIGLLVLTVKIIRLINLTRRKKTKYDKYIKRILTEYDRMISETKTKPNTNDVEKIEVNNFLELVDIRDTLRLPIMYYSITEHQKSMFYITHENKMYLYIVKAIDLEEKNNGKAV